MEVAHVLVDAWEQALQETTKFGELPLHLAVRCEAPLELVQYLVERDPRALQVLEHDDDDGRLPLHHAVCPLRGVVGSGLVPRQQGSEGRHVRWRDNDGRLPLHHAFRQSPPAESSQIPRNEVKARASGNG